jgi:hypothetical protein
VELPPSVADEAVVGAALAGQLVADAVRHVVPDVVRGVVPDAPAGVVERAVAGLPAAASVQAALAAQAAVSAPVVPAVQASLAAADGTAVTVRAVALVVSVLVRVHEERVAAVPQDAVSLQV